MAKAFKELAISTSYTHVLLATDLLQETRAVAEKAKQLSGLYHAKLTVMHVVESMPIYLGNEMMLPEMQVIESQLLEQAKKKMKALCQSLAIAESDGHVEMRLTKYEIIETAKQNSVDLIVLGSHSHHGLEHFLGSTARAVVNAAPCDVLAVRFK